MECFDLRLSENKLLLPLLFLLVFLCLENTVALAQEGESFPLEPGLEDYLKWAKDHHPAVAREIGRMTALRHAAQVAGALPDLRFGWGEMIVPVETRVGPQQRVFSLSQSFPWFGTLGLKETVAGQQADAAAQGVLVRLNQVHHDIRAAWFELAYLQGEIAILNENLDLARQTEAATRSTYETGAGSLGDVLAAQIEIEQMKARLAGLRDRVRPVAARLNLAAGLEAGHPVPVVSPASLERPDFHLSQDEALWAMLESHNPDLEAGKREQESHRQGVELAGKAGYPELTLGLDYIMTGPAQAEGIPDSGKDPVIARLGVSIPLWGGKAGARKKSSAGRLAAASADLTDTRRQLKARFEAGLYAWREAERNAELYGSVLRERARQALEVTSARYRSGQASYSDLVSARKTLLGLELAHLRAVADQSHALNDLALLVGTSLEELDAPGPEAGSDPGP